MHIQEIFHNYGSCLTLKRTDRRPFWSFYPSVKSTSLLFTEHPLYHPLYPQICPTVYDQFTEELFHFQKISHALQVSLHFQLQLSPLSLSLSHTHTHTESEILLPKSFSFINFRSLESASSNGMLSFEYLLSNVLGLKEESAFWNGNQSLFPQTSYSYPGSRKCPFQRHRLSFENI